MEIRLRSSVSRTARGYSIEATLDIGPVADPMGDPDALVNELSAFQIAKLKEHMAALGAAFPREDA